MRLFVLLSRIPYPLEKGDKLRAFHQLKELAKYHEISLCCLTAEKPHKEVDKILQSFCENVDYIYLSKIDTYKNLLLKLFFSTQSLQVAYFYNKRAQKKIDHLIKKYQPDHLYCQLIRVAEYVKDIPIPKTIDYMDALARGMERRINKVPSYLRPFFKIEANRLKKYEHEIFNNFDNKTIISKQDKELIVHINNTEIVVVPNGVDYNKFKVRDTPKKFDLIFTGNMAYPPNVNSVVYLVKRVMPIIWKHNKNITLAIVGVKPDREVVQLQNDRVTVTGWVDDIVDYYSKSKVFIAPMQIGTGLQNKLLEAMAMQLPCITSELVNNALNAIDGDSILIGNSPEDYAKYALELLSNMELSKHIAKNGYEFVTKEYTWEGSTHKLHQVISSS